LGQSCLQDPQPLPQMQADLRLEAALAAKRHGARIVRDPAGTRYLVVSVAALTA